MHGFLFKCAQCHEPIVQTNTRTGRDLFEIFPTKLMAEMALAEEYQKMEAEKVWRRHNTCGSIRYDVGEFKISMV